MTVPRRGGALGLGGCLQTAYEQEPTQTSAISVTTHSRVAGVLLRRRRLLGWHRSHRPIRHHDGADRAPTRQFPGHDRTQLIARRRCDDGQARPRTAVISGKPAGPRRWKVQSTNADNIDRRRVKARESDLRLCWTGSTCDGWELRHGPCNRTGVRGGQGFGGPH
jgi:hypothetical protein